MAGIGAAVSGFAQGMGQGLKLRSDLEDAEARRGLMALQGKQAQQAVDLGDEQAAARTEAAGIIKGYATGDTNLGFVRNEDGTYDPNRPENINRNYDLQAQSAARVALAHGQSPTKAIAEVNQLRKDGFQEGVNRASALYGMGDVAGGDAALKQVYPLFRDGRTFLGSEVDPQNPKQIALRYRDDKTGEEKSFSAPIDQLSSKVIPLALNLTDAANYNLRSKELDYRGQEVDLKKDELSALKDWRKVQEKLTGEELNIKKFSAESLDAYHKQMGKAAMARVNTENVMLNLSRETQALNNQLTAVGTLLGIDKKFDPAEHSKEEIAEHKAKLGMANTAMYLINQGITKGRLTVDATQAIQLAQAAENVPFADIKRDGPGLFSTTINGVKVPIGMTESDYKKLSAANAPKSAPGVATRPGITTPVDRDEIPVPGAPSRLRSGIATPDARGLLTTPSYGVQPYAFNPD